MILRAFVPVLTALFVLAVTAPDADAQNIRRPPPKNTVLKSLDGEDLPFVYYPGMALTPEQEAMLEAREEALLDKHSETRIIYPFEKPRWQFAGHACSTYAFAYEHGMHNEVAHFLKATWAFKAGKENRKYIVNPLAAKQQDPPTIAEAVYIDCLQEENKDKTILDVLESKADIYFPDTSEPPAGNANTAKWEMNRDVLDFSSVTCLNIAAQMMTNDPSEDFLSHQDIMWAYLAGEWEVQPLDILATRRAGNHMVKYHCLMTENPDTNLLALMRDNKDKLRDIMSGIIPQAR